MMNSEPGRFFFATTCRCGASDCISEVGAGVTARLGRVSVTPAADQPGDVVAMIVEEVHFPNGWSLDANDLKPRCPKHGAPVCLPKNSQE